MLQSPLISVGIRGPNPQFSLALPRIFGDGVGTGTGLSNILGDFRGWGWLQLWVLFGVLSLKNNWENFGDGDSF